MLVTPVKASTTSILHTLATGNLAVAAAAMVTAILFVIVFFDRFIARRRRLGYRVQFDDRVGDTDSPSGLAELGMRQNDNPVPDPSLVLVSITNTGSLDLEPDDFGQPLSIRFADRKIVGIEIRDVSSDYVRSELLRGFETNDFLDTDSVTMPKIALRRGDRIRLLTLLSGRGTSVHVSADIRGGRVEPRDSPRSPRWWALVGALAISLAVTVTIALLGEGNAPSSASCGTGQLQVLSSSDFLPALNTLAGDYSAACQGATISLAASGNSVDALQANTASGIMAVADQAVSTSYPALVGHPLATIPYAVVVNKATGVTALTTDQLRAVYRGQLTNWQQLGGANLPINIISRSAASAVRTVFDQKVIEQAEAPTTSFDCRTRDAVPQATYVRCEVSSAASLLSEVAAIPGAIGYTSLETLAQNTTVQSITINGNSPAAANIHAGADSYPFWSVASTYTYGVPSSDSVEAAFLDYLGSTSTGAVLRSEGLIPCVGQFPC